MTFALLAALALTAAETTPEQAVENAVKALADHKPAVIWNSMPESWQKDVTGLVHDAAGRMDAELWDKGLAVAKKALDVLKKQQTLILGELKSELPATIDQGKLSGQWEALIGVFETIANSDLVKLDSLAKLDVEKALAGDGAKSMQQLFGIIRAIEDRGKFPTGVKSFSDLPDLLSKAKITTERIDGDLIAIVKIEIDGGAKGEELHLVRIEGKWVPKALADTWKPALDRARTNLSRVSKDAVAAAKPQLMKRLDAIDKKLDELAKTKKPDEFHKLLVELVRTVHGELDGTENGK